MNQGNKGFVNLGNTCYMNSALQCLSHLPDFHPSNREFRQGCCQKNNNDLMNQWISLQEEMWSDESSGPLNPTQLLRTFQQGCHENNYYFENFSQNDVDEFITLFMDILHQSVKSSRIINIKGDVKTEVDQLVKKSMVTWKQFFKDDYSYIIDKFYSQLFSLTSCSECDYITTNHDPLMVLSLEIPGRATTLTDCLDTYTRKKRLDCDNQWKCDKCKKTLQPDTKLMLWNTSDILLILLKRYSGFRKNNQKIDFPIDLDMSEYNINHCKKGSQYTLHGMCIHDGGLGGGHYYAICKHIFDDQWYIYNDTTVTKIDESDLQSYHPYCFFYKRV